MPSSAKNASRSPRRPARWVQRGRQAKLRAEAFFGRGPFLREQPCCGCSHARLACAARRPSVRGGSPGHGSSPGQPCGVVAARCRCIRSSGKRAMTLVTPTTQPARRRRRHRSRRAWLQHKRPFCLTSSRRSGTPGAPPALCGWRTLSVAVAPRLQCAEVVRFASADVLACAACSVLDIQTTIRHAVSKLLHDAAVTHEARHGIGPWAAVCLTGHGLLPSVGGLSSGGTCSPVRGRLALLARAGESEASVRPEGARRHLPCHCPAPGDDGRALGDRAGDARSDDESAGAAGQGERGTAARHSSERVGVMLTIGVKRYVRM